jgi:predicted Rossmann-fold nucleotide-binding protein
MHVLCKVGGGGGAAAVGSGAESSGGCRGCKPGVMRIVARVAKDAKSL